MNLTKDQLKVILLKEGCIDEKDAEKADEFVKNKEGRFIDYFFRNGHLTTVMLGQAIAKFFNVPYFDPNKDVPNQDTILQIPEEVARKFRVILVKEAKDSATIATDDPLMEGLLDEVKRIFPDKKINTCFALSGDIDFLLLIYKKTLETRFVKIIGKGEKVALEIVDEILHDALEYKASDVHFDPNEKDVVIRFRIDGLLHEAGSIPISYYDKIINRIKIQSEIRTDEHFSALNGAIRYKLNDQEIDMRVSVVPTLMGERIVIRLFAEYMRNFTLDDIGLSKNHQRILLNAAQKPFGMILVTGPTGSGKTTTLYALLKYLNKKEINITTIEDPVEYRIPGVNHIQVNSATNLTFADGLKSIIRQDPDIILVGEIRDKETASTAVNAALAGHLLLSTFHANDAASVIPRFLEMGIDASNLSLTIRSLISQRLVRKICDKCRISYKMSLNDLNKILPKPERFFKDQESTFYKGKGCFNCSNTGYRGRTAIYEMIDITPVMSELILKNASANQLWEAEKQHDLFPIFMDGLEKVKNGTTTIEELLRAADPPE